MLRILLGWSRYIIISEIGAGFIIGMLFLAGVGNLLKIVGFIQCAMGLFWTIMLSIRAYEINKINRINLE